MLDFDQVDPDIVIVIILIVSGGGGGGSGGGGSIGGGDGGGGGSVRRSVPGTIVDVVPIAWMIVVVGSGGGGGIGGGGGGGGDGVQRSMPGTIVDVVPIAWMIVVVGNGDGGGGNGGGGGDSCLRRRAGWRQRFCGDRHVVKIGSPIKLKPRTLVFRRITQYYSSVWLSIDGLTFVT
jgi:hypothetical protein